MNTCVKMASALLARGNVMARTIAGINRTKSPAQVCCTFGDAELVFLSQ